jgi:nucleoside-diphosphate-sugar epimerase
MRIFLAGASGVVGRQLVPRLVADGHQVSAMTRKLENTDTIEAAGAEPVVCDVFDAERLRQVVVAARPDVVIQHLTDLPKDLNPRNLKKGYARNDRVRGEGSANLVAAADAAGARRYIAQTVCFLYAPTGPMVVGEEHPFAFEVAEPYGSSVRLHAEMERRIIENDAFEGLVLRFGFWYGPGTTFASDGFTAGEVRRRRYPIVGAGDGVQSFIHMDDVVDSTIAALTKGPPGAYNVTDDDPAPMREWLPEYAAALHAPAPRRVPAWLARIVAGRFIVAQATSMRGASNEKVKRELDWKPRYSSWREGFRVALG